MQVLEAGFEETDNPIDPRTNDHPLQASSSALQRCWPKPVNEEDIVARPQPQSRNRVVKEVNTNPRQF